MIVGSSVSNLNYIASMWRCLL